MTSIHETTFKMAIDYITTKLAKGFKPLSISGKSSFFYLEVKGTHYYILNGEKHYAMLRTNHKLVKIDTTNYNSVWDYVMNAKNERPKGYVNDYGSVFKNSLDHLHRYNRKTLIKTTQQKADSKQKKLYKIEFLKQQKIDDYKRKRYNSFVEKTINESIKFTRKIPDSIITGYLYLPYGFSYRGEWVNNIGSVGGEIYSNSLYVDTEKEFNEIIDFALSQYNGSDGPDYSHENYRDETYLIHRKKMDNLQRESVKLPYKNAINNVLLKNTKFSNDCMNAIMEYL